MKYSLAIAALLGHAAAGVTTSSYNYQGPNQKCESCPKGSNIYVPGCESDFGFDYKDLATNAGEIESSLDRQDKQIWRDNNGQLNTAYAGMDCTGQDGLMALQKGQCKNLYNYGNGLNGAAADIDTKYHSCESSEEYIPALIVKHEKQVNSSFDSDAKAAYELEGGASNHYQVCGSLCEAESLKQTGTQDLTNELNVCGDLNKCYNQTGNKSLGNGCNEPHGEDVLLDKKATEACVDPEEMVSSEVEKALKNAINKCLSEAISHCISESMSNAVTC